MPACNRLISLAFILLGHLLRIRYVDAALRQVRRSIVGNFCNIGVCATCGVIGLVYIAPSQTDSTKLSPAVC